MIQVLDVGCGAEPKGDVNCDLFIGKSPHLPERINPVSIPNFVQCHACWLPFRRKSFDVVYSSHVLEHLLYPVDALVEFKRVSKSVVYLKIPHMPKTLVQRRQHLFSWTKSTFENLLSLFFRRVESYYTQQVNLAIHGRKLDRMTMLKLAINWMYARLQKNEIVAICYN